MYRRSILFVLIGFSFSVFAQTKSGLFDGKTMKGWKVLGGTAKFDIEDGVIVGTTVLNSANTFLATEKEYSDFIMEIDVKLESPEGNSGIQTRSHYDPAGNKGKGKVYGRQVEVDPTARRWTGGIYDEGRRKWLYPMDLNAKAQSAYKSGDFNHFRIECIGNEIRTWVNAIACADVIDTIDNKGFIALQVHNVGKSEQAGKKVWFKNISIKTTGLKFTPFPTDIYVINHVPNTLTTSEKKSGWKLLFDGKTSKGWVGAYKENFPTKGWNVAKGAINVDGSGGGEAVNGDIVSQEQFSSFDLSFEFRMTPGANSGVKYFVTLSEKNQGSAIGLEYQVLDDSLHPDAKLGRDGDRTLASLYDLIKANKPSTSLRNMGDWNIGRIVVYPNNHVEHYLNGVKVLEYDRGSQAYRDLVAISKYKVWDHFGEAPQGRILLQDHGFVVSFRSVKIKELK